MLGEGLCGEVAFLGVFDTVAAMDGIHRKGEKISTDVVFENGTLHAHSGLMVSAGGEEPRRVCVNDNDVKSKDADDLPIVHHSARQRFREVADYRPAALRGLKFHLLLPDGALTNEIHGISGLRFS